MMNKKNPMRQKIYNSQFIIHNSLTGLMQQLFPQEVA